MDFPKLLGLRPGVTAVIGSGGKPVAAPSGGGITGDGPPLYHHPYPPL